MQQPSMKEILTTSFLVVWGLVGCSAKIKSKRHNETPSSETSATDQTDQSDISDDTDAGDDTDGTDQLDASDPSPQGPQGPQSLGINFTTPFSPSGSAFVLSNGNLIVTDGQNSKAASRSGAIFVYEKKTGTLLSETYGDQVDDFLGNNGSIYQLSNGNFTLRSPEDNNGTVLDAGSVILFNGITGKEISRINGDQEGDNLGKNSVGELANGNAYIVSADDNCSGAVNCGSIILFDPATGVEISRVTGERDNDHVGSYAVKNLPNGNFIIRSPSFNTATLTGAGALHLVNGTTGSEITKIEGSSNGEALSGRASFVLPNGNIVLSSATAVTLLNGSTGAVIGTVAERPSNHLNSTGIVLLKNGNYVIHNHATTNAIVGAGFTILVNGTTGSEISRISGDSANDQFGYYDIVELTNGNYVMRDPDDDDNGLTDNGSVILVNGATGTEISRISGTQSNSKLGGNWIYALANGNYVIASSKDDTATLTDSGSVILVNGSTGVEISRIAGDQNDDQLGLYRIFEITGGRYVIRSPSDNTANFTNAGSVIFADSTTGAELKRFSGDKIDAQLSKHVYVRYVAPGIIDSEEVLQLANGNIVLTNIKAGFQGRTDAGVAILIKGSDLSEIAGIGGNQNGDNIGWRTVAIDANRFALINPFDDENGFIDNGSVMIVDAKTGAVLNTLFGKGNDSLLGLVYVRVDPALTEMFISDSLAGAESITAFNLVQPSP